MSDSEEVPPSPAPPAPSLVAPPNMDAFLPAAPGRRAPARELHSLDSDSEFSDAPDAPPALTPPIGPAAMELGSDDDDDAPSATAADVIELSDTDHAPPSRGVIDLEASDDDDDPPGSRGTSDDEPSKGGKDDLLASQSLAYSFNLKTPLTLTVSTDRKGSTESLKTSLRPNANTGLTTLAGMGLGPGTGKTPANAAAAALIANASAPVLAPTMTALRLSAFNDDAPRYRPSSAAITAAAAAAAGGGSSSEASAEVAAMVAAASQRRKSAGPRYFSAPACADDVAAMMAVLAAAQEEQKSEGADHSQPSESSGLGLSLDTTAGSSPILPAAAFHPHASPSAPSAPSATSSSSSAAPLSAAAIAAAGPDPTEEDHLRYYLGLARGSRGSPVLAPSSSASGKPSTLSLTSRRSVSIPAHLLTSLAAKTNKKKNAQPVSEEEKVPDHIPPLLRPAPLPPRLSSHSLPSPLCFLCHSPGHTSRECPAPPFPASPCASCGCPGHDAGVCTAEPCPRCLGEGHHQAACRGVLAGGRDEFEKLVLMFGGAKSSSSTASLVGSSLALPPPGLGVVLPAPAAACAAAKALATVETAIEKAWSLAAGIVARMPPEMRAGAKVGHGLCAKEPSPVPVDLTYPLPHRTTPAPPSASLTKAQRRAAAAAAAAEAAEAAAAEPTPFPSYSALMSAVPSAASDAPSPFDHPLASVRYLLKAASSLASSPVLRFGCFPGSVRGASIRPAPGPCDRCGVPLHPPGRCRWLVTAEAARARRAVADAERAVVNALDKLRSDDTAKEGSATEQRLLRACVGLARLRALVDGPGAGSVAVDSAAARLRCVVCMQFGHLACDGDRGLAQGQGASPSPAGLAEGETPHVTDAATGISITFDPSLSAADRALLMWLPPALSRPPILPAAAAVALADAANSNTAKKHSKKRQQEGEDSGDESDARAVIAAAEGSALLPSTAARYAIWAVAFAAASGVSAIDASDVAAAALPASASAWAQKTPLPSPLPGTDATLPLTHLPITARAAKRPFKPAPAPLPAPECPTSSAASFAAAVAAGEAAARSVLHALPPPLAQRGRVVVSARSLALPPALSTAASAGDSGGAMGAGRGCTNCASKAHSARECTWQRFDPLAPESLDTGASGAGFGAAARLASMRCFRCQGLGHQSSQCPQSQSRGHGGPLVAAARGGSSLPRRDHVGGTKKARVAGRRHDDDDDDGDDDYGYDGDDRQSRYRSSSEYKGKSDNSSRYTGGNYSGPQCRNCQGWGHIARDCPRGSLVRQISGAARKGSYHLDPNKLYARNAEEARRAEGYRRAM